MNSTFYSNLHLPLNAIDQRNNPPLHFLWVQDGCILMTGALWTAAYVLYIRQGFKDRSYGMPLVPLCFNIGWEFAYGVLYPLSVAETLTFVPWLLIDAGIVYTTIQYGPEQWKHAPVVAQNIKPLLGLGIAFSLVVHWAFIETVGSVDDAGLWSGFGCQFLLGTSSVAQIMARGNTGGHSWKIWLFRGLGTSFAVTMFSWRYWFYPESYPLVGSPMAILLFVCVEVVDLIYPFVYSSIASREKVKSQ
ncbi:hypothetical protein F4777DRAFT_539019 [Nemania sp. FL0916]|nr:hypothetical protein F4777DRAFT_539019 [Nemania sp. FL0916]